MLKAGTRTNVCFVLSLLINMIVVCISFTIIENHQAEAITTASNTANGAKQNTLGCDTTYLIKGFGTTYDNNVLVMGTNGVCRVAQSFRLDKDSYVSYSFIRLNYPYKGSGNLKGTIYIAIRRTDSSGLPIGDPLTVGSIRAEGNIRWTSYIWNTYWTKIGFNQPALLEANTSYCFEIWVEPDPGCVCTFWTLVSQNDIYEDGCAYFTDCPTCLGCANGVGPDLNLELGGCEAQSWSFAIITDLHVGEGATIRSQGMPDLNILPDYGETGWNDNASSGQESIEIPGPWCEKFQMCNQLISIPSVWNLKIAVGYINMYKELLNTKFVVIDGDLTDSAEISEFGKAKEILNKLSIPWVPTMGNHDVWPYITASDKASATEIHNGYFYGTEWYFNEEMYDVYTNFSRYFPSFNRTSDAVWIVSALDGNFKFFENFCFDYGDYHFIGLDFNARHPAPNGKGVPPKTDMFETSWNPFKTVPGGTWDWFTNNIEVIDNQSTVNNIILFAHHPIIEYVYGIDNIGPWEIGLQAGFDESYLEQIYGFLENYNGRFFGEFGGHLHRNHVDSNFEGQLDIIETGANKDAPQVRIVTVYANGSIDYNTLLPKKAASFTAHCPVDLSVTDPDGLVINHSEIQIPNAMYYKWDFNGDGQFETKIWIPERKPGNYSIQVIPEPSANVSDTFTLIASPMEQKWDYTPIIVAQNVTISDIAAEPYIFEFKQRTTTNIFYTGICSSHNLDTTTLTAVLSTENGSRLSGKAINFMIGNQSSSAMTDSNGSATASIILNQTPSKFYYVEYGFDGDIDYLPYYDSMPFDIINTPPVADSGGPYIGDEGYTMTFNGSNSYDPDGIIANYEWDFGNGSTEMASNESPTHTYDDNGMYTVTLTVIDNAGATSTATTTVTVNNIAPTVDAGSDVNNALVNTPISFSGSFTDPGWLDTHTIEWNFGDGTPIVTGTLTPIHNYASANDYTVTLIVTDDDGGIGTDTATVTVWNYIFLDNDRSTELRINTTARTYRFLAPHYDTGIKEANRMLALNSLLSSSQWITITDWDSDIFLTATGYGGDKDYCVATLWDKETRKAYWLYDKWGIE